MSWKIHEDPRTGESIREWLPDAPDYTNALQARGSTYDKRTHYYTGGRNGEVKAFTEAEILHGRRLYREGWRQVSRKYRDIARGREIQEGVPVGVFAAFKLEEERAWTESEQCSDPFPVRSCIGRIPQPVVCVPKPWKKRS